MDPVPRVYGQLLMGSSPRPLPRYWTGEGLPGNHQALESFKVQMINVEIQE